MNEITQISKSKCFEGDQLVYSHYSDVCNCDMTFALYLPVHTNAKKLQIIWFLSGLTCTHENAMIKSGIQRWASEEKIAVIFPDTSPRGDGVADDDNFDLGQGAGFYVNSTENPWKKNFQMWSYIVDELPSLVFKEFPLVPNKQSIMGHSMGGLGALNIAFRNPEIYKTVSAFAPIANPTKGVWGQKQFEAYLGNDIVTIVPLFSLFFLIEKLPSCSFIIFVTIGRPKPVPVFLVVKYGVIAFLASVIPGPLSFIFNVI